MASRRPNCSARPMTPCTRRSGTGGTRRCWHKNSGWMAPLLPNKGKNGKNRYRRSGIRRTTARQANFRWGQPAAYWNTDPRGGRFQQDSEGMTGFRSRLVSPCRCFASSRRSTDFPGGRVFLRGSTGSAAFVTQRIRRSRASLRFCSCVRNRPASMTSTPSRVTRFPAIRINRSRTSPGRERERRTSNRSWTVVATLLTFCPPGPEDRINLSRISPSSRWMVPVIRIMPSWYQGGPSSCPDSVRLRKGGDAPLVVDGGGIDAGTDGDGEHAFRRIRDEKGRQRIRVLERRVEPPGVFPPRKDHRHPVVDRDQDGIRVGRQDRARLDAACARAFPSVPQPGEGEEMPVAHPDVVRLFSALFPLPLVEAAGGDQAPAPFESVAERRLFTCGFGACVDEAVADRGVFRPGRNEAPAEKGKLASFSRRAGAYGSDGLGRGDVVARRQRGEAGDAELPGEDLIRLEQGEPAAHRQTSAIPYEGQDSPLFSL